MLTEPIFSQGSCSSRSQNTQAIRLPILPRTSNTLVGYVIALHTQSRINSLGSVPRSDNDQYSHINNSVYYHLFDSIVNTYLIEHCNLSPQTSPLIGLVVSSFCQFFAPLSFPQALDLGLRINHLGKSSVSYEIAVFEVNKDEPAVVGGYTH